MFKAPALPFAPVLTGKVFEVSGAFRFAPLNSVPRPSALAAGGDLGFSGFQSGFLVTPGLSAVGCTFDAPVTPGLCAMGGSE